MTDEVLLEASGPLGLITLNRPHALNALTLGMIRAIDPQLRAWAADPSIRAVVMRAAGNRAFCAGGDLRDLYDMGPEAARRLTGQPDQDFFRHEYLLNWRIHHFPKPYVALIDGVVMGGGVGLAVHGSHRLAGERILFAMPECGIGFFPDVGGGWFLPRCPGALGRYLALTGARLGLADARYAGIATHHVPGDRMAALIDDLADADWSGDPGAVVDRMLATYAGDAGPAPLAEARAAIDRVFDADSVEAIRDGLAGIDEAWADDALHALDGKSPTSLKVALRQLRHGQSMDYDSCVIMEYRLAHAFLAAHDFFEGIRAVVVDKDRTPRWWPADLAHVADQAVDRYFAPLGDRDLVLA
ncbi:MAG: enoyl-CoA hydratase/isomerase family protein [Alphaproteobacteria bacterium]